MSKHSFKVVLVGYGENLLSPPDWVSLELVRHGITRVIGQYHTPEAVLDALCSGEVLGE